MRARLPFSAKAMTSLTLCAAVSVMIRSKESPVMISLRSRRRALSELVGAARAAADAEEEVEEALLGRVPAPAPAAALPAGPAAAGASSVASAEAPIAIMLNTLMVSPAESMGALRLPAVDGRGGKPPPAPSALAAVFPNIPGV